MLHRPVFDLNRGELRIIYVPIQFKHVLKPYLLVKEAEDGNSEKKQSKAKLNMARVREIPKFIQYSLYFTVILSCFSNKVAATRELNEDNWRDILEGEWMVEL